MAVKWAVANGNWSAGTTWNDGVVPAVGDDVYLNGHTITGNVDINIGSGTITNNNNDELGINSGGSITISVANRTISANLEAYNFSNLITTNNRIIIIGNITSYIPTSSSYAVIYCIGTGTGTSSNNKVTITGNTISGLLGATVARGVNMNNATGGGYNYLIITGNTDRIYHHLTSAGSSGTATISIVGNITDSYINSRTGNYLTDVTVNGKLLQQARLLLSNIRTLVTTDYYNLTNSLQTITTLNVSGNIHYAYDFGRFVATTLNYLTPLTSQYINEGSTSPFQIVNSNTGIDYPPESSVKIGIEYAYGQMVGTYTPDFPPEAVVLDGYIYDNGDKTGSLSAQAQVGCVTKEDVREGVALIGMGEVGTLVVPSVDDVREGVVFDNGSVGTLIVQGGGDRLRIADFGYYTNAQSDTYIVDLTEQDKPKFAVAEERVLIEMFPDLDLENIPDKYFDDLFVKYLKYRLIVEYYRTAGINSTFTPSEPTTEIVNYQNVRNEVWLNSANIYLKAWAKKYPDCITRPQRILL